MKQIRKEAINEKSEEAITITQKHGIISHMIPLINQLSFTRHTEDVIVTKRKGTSSMLGKRKIDHDIQINLMTKNLLEKRLKVVNGFSGQSNDYERRDETIEADAQINPEEPECI